MGLVRFAATFGGTCPGSWKDCASDYTARQRPPQQPAVSCSLSAWTAGGWTRGLLDAEGGLIEKHISLSRRADHRSHGERLHASAGRKPLRGYWDSAFCPSTRCFSLRRTSGLAYQRAPHDSCSFPTSAISGCVGSLVCELTNASTTQLLDVRRASWNDDLFERLGLPRALMPELVPAQTRYEVVCGAIW